MELSFSQIDKSVCHYMYSVLVVVRKKINAKDKMLVFYASS